MTIDSKTLDEWEEEAVKNQSVYADNDIYSYKSADHICRLIKEIRGLLAENRELRCGLEFYADPYGAADLVDDNDYEINTAYPKEDKIPIPGKIAREVLAKFPEEKK